MQRAAACCRQARAAGPSPNTPRSHLPPTQASQHVDLPMLQQLQLLSGAGVAALAAEASDTNTSRDKKVRGRGAWLAWRPRQAHSAFARQPASR